MLQARNTNCVLIWFILSPVMVMSLVLWIFQFFLASFVFRDRQFPNISVSIDNR